MIKIISDSACDLSEEVVSKYNIGIVPISIIMDGIDYKDGIDIKSDEFYKMLEKSENLSTTAAPGPGEYLDLIEKSVEEGYKKILCINISANMSVSYQSALVAKQTFFEENPESQIEIFIVDSFSVGHGSGWVILKAVDLLERGYKVEEIIEFIDGYKRKVRHLLCVNDLDSMKKSGRISNINAIIGKLLRVKPILTMINGKGRLIERERGINRVLDFYVNELESKVDKKESNFIIISYTSDIKPANTLAEKIKKETSYKGKIYIMQMGAAVGVYVGLGSFAMYYGSRENIE